MTDELKPVPCGCGGEAEVLKFNNETWLVMCNKCRTSSENYTSKDKAITAWNRAMGAKDINIPNKFATDTNVGNEIICCKDCKYSHMTIDGLCKYCDIWFPEEEMYADGKHFCASAEKRML